MPIFYLWLLFRLLTSVFIALVSSFRPLTDLEYSLPLIPPSSPLNLWLERALLSPWLRWDVVWYQRIVINGYQATDGTAQFHPLYPWLASIFYNIGAHPLFSLLFVSSIAGLSLLLVYHRLARLDLSPSDASFSLLLLLLAPSAFIIFSPYSEALFLLCAGCCVYYSRQKRWWLAGLAGGCAVLTRQQGLFLLLPMALEIWETNGRRLPQFRAEWRDWLSLAILPVSYSLWLGYRLLVLNDFSVNVNSFHNFIYSFMISPSASEVVPHQTFLWPWRAMSLAIHELIETPNIDLWVNIIAAVVFLVLLSLGWQKMRLSYKIYTITITLISLSYYTGIYHPYMGLPRHLLLAFPVFIAAAPRLNRTIWGPLFITASSIGYLFFLLIFSLESWVP